MDRNQENVSINNYLDQLNRAINTLNVQEFRDYIGHINEQTNKLIQNDNNIFRNFCEENIINYIQLDTFNNSKINDQAINESIKDIVLILISDFNQFIDDNKNNIKENDDEEKENVPDHNESSNLDGWRYVEPEPKKSVISASARNNRSVIRANNSDLDLDLDSKKEVISKLGKYDLEYEEVIYEFFKHYDEQRNINMNDHKIFCIINKIYMALYVMKHKELYNIGKNVLNRLNDTLKDDGSFLWKDYIIELDIKLEENIKFNQNYSRLLSLLYEANVKTYNDLKNHLDYDKVEWTIVIINLFTIISNNLKK